MNIPQHSEKMTSLLCPLCKKGRLVSRRNRKTGTNFLGCTNYPNCKYSRNIYSPGEQYTVNWDTTRAPTTTNDIEIYSATWIRATT